MTVKLSRLAPALGALVWLAASSPAMAQWYPFAGLFNPCACGPRPMMAPASYGGGCSNGACGIAPTAMSNPCGCASAPVACTPAPVACAPAMVVQPVTETVMRQVPVTEYRQVRQTVRKPVVETTYVDQPITEYRQVVEQKTVCVPTVAYQDVTECQTVQRQCGQWVTKWHCNQKMSPCQYDNRPGLVGEMNRTGYAMRQAFVPAQYATREYQSQVVAQQIPTTRRVAVQGTKQVTYNVARTVPIQSTRKVATNTVKYIDEEVVVMQPVTVVKNVPTTRTTYRLVPAGSALALGPTYNSATALGPTPDPVSATTVPSRSQSAAKDGAKDRTSDSRANETPATRSSLERRSSLDDEYDDGRRATRDASPQTTVRFVAAKTPDSARVMGWRPRVASENDKPVQRSQRATATMTVAEMDSLLGVATR